MNRFLRFPLQLYGDTPSIRNWISKTRGLINTTGGYDLYVAEVDNRVNGRMSICVDHAVNGNDNQPVIKVGLFEVVEDYDVFRSMMDFAKSFTGKSGNILFPMHVSTWYPYRFSSGGNDRFTFFFENPDKPYYNEYAKRYGIGQVYTYKSILSHDIERVIHKNHKYYKKAEQDGFSFLPFDTSRPEAMLRILYDISIRAFRDNLFYTPIEWEDFYNLHIGTIKMIDEDLFTFALDKNGDPVGFCFSSPDYTGIFERFRLDTPRGKLGFVLNKNKARGTIIKTVAVLPEYRGRGLQGALTYLHAIEAKKRTHEYIIGALIYTGNSSPKVLGEPVIEKEYELYTM